jgi:hypothetical protein
MGTIRIEIDVQHNTVICGENGGHVRVRPGDRIKWQSADRERRFTLEFFRLAFEGGEAKVDVRELGHWPFVDSKPERGIVGPTSEFLGTLKDKKKLKDGEYAAFKYYVTVGNLRLDPIIIIDRIR